MTQNRKPPTRIDQFRPKLEAFKKWLRERGSEVLAPTNDYEVIRFYTSNGAAVIYANKAGKLAFANNAQAALVAFYTGGSDWRATPRAPVNHALPDGSKRRLQRIRSIALRDGWTCGLCGGTLNERTASVEHFVARTAGGPDHPANLILAHHPCNQRASHLSVREKIELAIQLRKHPIYDPLDPPDLDAGALDADPWAELDPALFGPAAAAGGSSADAEDCVT